MTYTVAIYQDGDAYTVQVPALPGCLTCGSTLYEAFQMAEEAITGFLLVLQDEGKPVPVEGDSVSVQMGELVEMRLYRIDIPWPPADEI